MNHGSYEFSSKLQTIEIYSPNRDKNGKFLGLNHEAIFYDPEALVEPVRIVRNYVKTSDFQKATPFVFIECIPTIYPIDGKAVKEILIERELLEDADAAEIRSQDSEVREMRPRSNPES